MPLMELYSQENNQESRPKRNWERKSSSNSAGSSGTQVNIKYPPRISV